MSLVELKSAPKSAAPGQYLGFSLQQLRLCYYLLEVSDGESVSLEYVDDIAVHRFGGSLILEQAKSGLSGNPSSDRSEELWKTFANWADRCSEGIDPTATDFVLYVTPSAGGEIVASLHAATDATTATAALVAVKKLIDPKKPDVGCSPFIAHFLALGDEICIQVIERFQIIAETDPVEAIRKKLRPTLPSDTLDDFCATAIGMARDMADELIRKKVVAAILAVEFRKRFRAFVRKHDLSGLLVSSAQEPSQAEIDMIVDHGPTFVQQLNAVEASTDMLVIAVSDYLRTVIDKTTWAEEGAVVPGSLDELDQQLARQHGLLREEIEDTQAAECEKLRGRQLYRRCAQTALPLEGRALPSHFVAGAYNCLADIRRLGWHPNYKTLFPEE